jgi:hypothetical protein
MTLFTKQPTVVVALGADNSTEFVALTGFVITNVIKPD